MSTGANADEMSKFDQMMAKYDRRLEQTCSGAENGGMSSALQGMLWFLSIFFIIIIIAGIIMYAVTAGRIPVNSETYYKFKEVATPVPGNANVSVYIKVGLDDGINQDTIPKEASILEICGNVFSNTVRFPPTATQWNIYAQAIGQAVNGQGGVNAVYVQIQELGDASAGGTYTRGWDDVSSGDDV